MTVAPAWLCLLVVLGSAGVLFLRGLTDGGAMYVWAALGSRMAAYVSASSQCHGAVVRGARRRRSNVVSRLQLATVIVGAGLLAGAVFATTASAQLPPDADAIVRNVYPSARELRVREQPAIGVVTVAYVVPVAYPSRVVVEHYATLLAGLGWKPEPGDVGADGREWQCFQDGTRKGVPIVHQLLARWVSADRSREMILALRYDSPGDGPDSISCQCDPASDRQQVLLQINPTGTSRETERGS